MTKRTFALVASTAFLSLLPFGGYAQYVPDPQPSQLEARIRQLESNEARLEERLRQLEKRGPVIVTPSPQIPTLPGLPQPKNDGFPREFNGHTVYVIPVQKDQE